MVRPVMEPIFEADFQPCSYGFRPKRSAQQALEVIRVAGNQGHNFVVGAKVPVFMKQVGANPRGLDGRTLRLADPKGAAAGQAPISKIALAPRAALQIHAKGARYVHPQ